MLHAQVLLKVEQIFKFLVAILALAHARVRAFQMLTERSPGGICFVAFRTTVRSRSAVQTLVFNHVVLIPELASAKLALERPTFRVDDHVAAERRQRRKHLVAVFALVLPLAGVRPHVDSTVARLGERLGANRTVIRPLASVDSPMRPQMGMLRESLGTLGTFVRLCAGVHPLVDSQGVQVRKSRAAIFASMRSIARMQSHVRSKTVRVGE